MRSSHLRSVSLLDRSASGRAVCYRSGEPIDHTRNHLHRIFTFLLMLDRAPASVLATEILLEVVHRSESHEWPNIIVALKDYIVTFACDDGICPNTADARGMSVIPSRDRSDTLLQFYLFLSQAVTLTSVAQASSWAYLGGLVARGNILFSATNQDGEPPPYLSSLQILPWEYPYERTDEAGDH